MIKLIMMMISFDLWQSHQSSLFREGFYIYPSQGIFKFTPSKSRASHTRVARSAGEVKYTYMTWHQFADSMYLAKLGPLLVGHVIWQH